MFRDFLPGSDMLYFRLVIQPQKQPQHFARNIKVKITISFTEKMGQRHTMTKISDICPSKLDVEILCNLAISNNISSTIKS